ncbi:MAG: endopeptidase La [Chloroflexota bacterium]|nr:endopeptidase La [Chloroflexota bacterium]MDE3193800.1 endopeptidase La [Chloroflexota bacterium]
MTDETLDRTYPAELPLVPLREAVIFPKIVTPLGVGREKSVNAINAAMAAEKHYVILAAQKDAEVDDVKSDQIYHVGTVAEIVRLLRIPDGSAQIIVQGLDRVRITGWADEPKYFRALFEVIPDDLGEAVEREALMRSLRTLFQQYVDNGGSVLPEVAMTAKGLEDASHFADLIATTPDLNLEQRQHLLETRHVVERLRFLSVFLAKQNEILELKAKIQSEVQSTIDKTQREYILREQMKTIQKELGEDEGSAELKELREKIEAAGMPEPVKDKALKEVSRLEKIPQASPETGVIRTYVDWLISLPWKAAAPDDWDIAAAGKILDEDHYGLGKVKDRIIEYMAVRKLTQDVRAPILCFVGPPGVGKTSLGKSIARAMGRKFIRMSLGGIRDEAEIRGHRRTYVGALPGRIIQNMKVAAQVNPVFMLDEIDKVGADFRGDPSSALLEVLDPEQNNTFQDHYLEVPYDLSKVIFITTANVEDTIIPPLRDRMEVIRLPGYTEDEKMHIALGYLLPRQLKQHGLLGDAQPVEEPTIEAATETAPDPDTVPEAAAPEATGEASVPGPATVPTNGKKLDVTEDALRKIIREYTREAGVRNLEREIGSICRKVARKVAGGEVEEVTVDAADISTYLGPERFEYGLAEKEDMVGAATGVSVSEFGGDVLTVEATTVDGTFGEGRDFQLTGQIGKVMEESARAAMSWVRAHQRELGVPKDFFRDHAMHIHVPAGAIPKDGPSAGVTMATTIVSALTGRPVRRDVAMTGEITLRGKVLPIGGVKEKLLAAHRAGIKTFILPEKNKKDLVDIPKEVLDTVDVKTVGTIDEVLALALLGGPRVTPAAFGPRDMGRPAAPPPA